MKFRHPNYERRTPALRGGSGSPQLQPGRNHCSKADGRTWAVGIRAFAFSLIEILIVVALLSVIILGLLAMFTQTQRAYRTGLTQTDVLQSGRLVTDMLGRELEQIAPAYQSSPNFYARAPFDASIYSNVFVQPLPGPPPTGITRNERTNLLHDLFFISKRNQDYVGIGYFVRVSNPQNGNLSPAPLGAGNLYRFETNTTNFLGRTVANLFNEFSLALLNESNATKLAEGVIHFKVRAFDTNGAWIVTNNQNLSIVANYDKSTSQKLAGDIEVYQFTNSAVPGTVELELGILEDKAWQRFKALPAFGSPNAQEKYLTNQVGRVHLFRQRVAVRNLDPIAYQ